MLSLAATPDKCERELPLARALNHLGIMETQKRIAAQRQRRTFRVRKRTCAAPPSGRACA